MALSLKLSLELSSTMASESEYSKRELCVVVQNLSHENIEKAIGRCYDKSHKVPSIVKNEIRGTVSAKQSKTRSIEKPEKSIKMGKKVSNGNVELASEYNARATNEVATNGKIGKKNINPLTLNRTVDLAVGESVVREPVKKKVNFVGCDLSTKNILKTRLRSRKVRPGEEEKLSENKQVTNGTPNPDESQSKRVRFTRLLLAFARGVLYIIKIVILIHIFLMLFLWINPTSCGA